MTDIADFTARLTALTDGRASAPRVRDGVMTLALDVGGLGPDQRDAILAAIREGGLTVPVLKLAGIPMGVTHTQYREKKKEKKQKDWWEKTWRGRVKWVDTHLVRPILITGGESQDETPLTKEHKAAEADAGTLVLAPEDVELTTPRM